MPCGTEEREYGGGLEWTGKERVRAGREIIPVTGEKDLEVHAEKQ
jgi:hypothetical protein